MFSERERGSREVVVYSIRYLLLFWEKNKAEYKWDEMPEIGGEV